MATAPSLFWRLSNSWPRQDSDQAHRDWRIDPKPARSVRDVDGDYSSAECELQ
jgi:hypothetical protein